MIRKTTTAKIQSKRSVTTFFNRIMENFERKFDGFPAAPDKPTSMPAVQEGAFPDFDMQAIVDKIAKANYDPALVPCPEVTTGDCKSCDGCVEHFHGVALEWGKSTIQCADFDDAGSIDTDLFPGSATRQAGIGRMIAPAQGFTARYLTLPRPPVVQGDLEILMLVTLWLGEHPANSIQGAAEFSLMWANGLEANDDVRVQTFVSGTPPYTGDEHFTLGGVAAYSANSAGPGDPYPPGGFYNHSFALTKGNNAGAASGNGIARDGDPFYIRLTYSSTGVGVTMWLADEPDPGGSGSIQSGNAIPSDCDTLIIRLIARQTADVGFGTSEQAAADIDFIEVVNGIECTEEWTVSDPALSTMSSDCSGEVITDTLLDNDTHYSTRLSNAGIYEVFYDDIMAVKDVDYTITDTQVYPISPLAEGTVVKARYKIL